MSFPFYKSDKAWLYFKMFFKAGEINFDKYTLLSLEDNYDLKMS